jgi:hypothetical protein
MNYAKIITILINGHEKLDYTKPKIRLEGT